MNIQIQTVNPYDEKVSSLIKILDQYQIDLYGRECCHLDSQEELSKENVVMLGAFVEENIAGIGAIKFLGEYAEIKRMYFNEEYRGLGLATKLLDGLEQIAKSRKVETIKLETGMKQLAAQNFYKKNGYVNSGPFGTYNVNHVSLFMEKSLPASRVGDKSKHLRHNQTIVMSSLKD